jgi:hypothetical protein
LQHPVSLAGLSFEERLCTQVRKDRMACPAATWQTEIPMELKVFEVGKALNS